MVEIRHLLLELIEDELILSFFLLILLNLNSQFNILFIDSILALFSHLNHSGVELIEFILKVIDGLVLLLSVLIKLFGL